MKCLYKQYYITQERIARVEFNDELKKHILETLLHTRRFHPSINLANIVDNAFIEYCFTGNKELIKEVKDNWLFNDEEVQRIIKDAVDDYIDEKGSYNVIGLYDYEIEEVWSKED